MNNQKTNPKFLKKTISSAIALLIATGASYPLMANAQEKEIIEEVVVTGIRAGLMQSMDVKKESTEIVDAISSEDVGKFPDKNIAEALQRIPGVAITRDSGEGRRISIRGLGEDFALVLFNDRQIASEAWGRSFDLDVLSSDLIRTTEVFKSSNARLTEGGVGGVVNIKTLRPFDDAGFHAVGKVEGVYTETSDKTEPQFSALVSNTFADDTIGLLAAVNAYKRTQQNNSASTWATLSDKTGWAGLGEGQGDPIIAGPTGKGKQVAQIGATAITDERERLTLSLTGQYKPNDDLLVTLDYMRNKFDSRSEGYGYFVTLDGGWGEINPNSIVYSEPDAFDRSTLLKFTRSVGAFENSYLANGRDVTAEQFGVNVEWNINDSLKSTIDAFYSEATEDNRDLGANIVTRYYPDPQFGYTYDYTMGGDVPVLTPAQGGTIEATEANKGRYFPSDFNRFGEPSEAENYGGKLDFVYSPDVEYLASVDFGASYAKNSKAREVWNRYDNTMRDRLGLTGFTIEKLYAENAGRDEVKLYVPADMLTIKSLNTGFSGLPNAVAAFSLDDYIAFLSNPASLQKLETSSLLADGEAQAVVNQWGFGTYKNGSETDVSEEIAAAYVNFNLTLSETFKATIGARYTTTDITSAGTFPLVIDLVTPANPTPEQIVQKALEPVYANQKQDVYQELSNSYDNVLPSATFTWNVRDDVIVRGAASQTLNRPNLGDLAVYTVPGSLTESRREAAAGNPFLKPYLSTNYDLSFEYYYEDDSYLALAGYVKEIDDWILGNKPFESDEYFDLESSEYNTFIINSPGNTDSVSVKGLEFSWSQIFDNGIGYSYTRNWVQTDAGPEEAYSMGGVSNTSNTSVFYEAGAWQLRVSYNTRDGYLANPNYFMGAPLQVKPFETVDASINWALNDNVNFYIDGTNILDATYATYAWTEHDWMSAAKFGPRYSAGVRVKF